MKIGITGDTHGSAQALRKILQATPPVELWLHTGDHAEDANVLQSMTGIRTVRVRGNCDSLHDASKPDEFLELEGFRLWLTHGHKYIKWDEKADLGGWAQQLEQDIVVYGHTHAPVCAYYGGVLLLNPGSPARPRGGSKPCFAVLTLQRGDAPQVKFIDI